VKVVRFSIGFGPRLFGFVRGETEYRISALPLGGYVKMAGDDPSEAPAPEDRGRGFLEQKPWRRLAIAVAGPAMNLVFPGLIFVGMMVSLNGSPTPGPVIGTVAPGSPAAVAGLRPGDRILSVAAPGAAAEPVRYFSDLRALVSPHPGEPLVFRVNRDGREIEPATIVPNATEERNILEVTRRGVIGVTPTYATATVAPVAPGAAGPLHPFDLVVSANGKPIRHSADLTAALEAARCAPLDLEVVREGAIDLPAARLGAFAPVSLREVPTCVDGKPSFRLADPEVSTFVASVEPGSPAEKAGIARGDAIASLNGKPVQSFLDVVALARDFKPGVPVAVGLAGGRTVQLVPENESYLNEIKERDERLWLGFASARRAAADPAALQVETVPLARGLVEVAEGAWHELGRMIRTNVLGVVKIVTGKISAKQVSGPLGIISMTAEAAEDGWLSFLNLMAFISVNLALMNLLPIPVLDGGHITQALLESVTRRPLSVRAREIANVVGLILLFSLMLFAFKNDIWRMWVSPS
jgi:regulator of sigma E protease